MYYFLSDRILIMKQDLDGNTEPLTMEHKQDAKEWVESMNRKIPEQHFQYFKSNTIIEIKSNREE